MHADAKRRLDASIASGGVTCGYDLRAIEDCCPECGGSHRPDANPAHQAVVELSGRAVIGSARADSTIRRRVGTMTEVQEATVILEVNCHSKSPGVSVWVVLGEYDDNDLDSPGYSEMDAARRIVGPVPPAIGQELQRNVADLLRQLGLNVSTLETADD